MLDIQQKKNRGSEVIESETDLTSIFYCCLSANGKQVL